MFVSAVSIDDKHDEYYSIFPNQKICITRNITIDKSKDVSYFMTIADNDKVVLYSAIDKKTALSLSKEYSESLKAELKMLSKISENKTEIYQIVNSGTYEFCFKMPDYDTMQKNKQGKISFCAYDKKGSNTYEDCEHSVWWDFDYNYRQKIIFYANQSISNVSKQIQIVWNNYMKNDFSDLIFTSQNDSDGFSESEEKFYLDSKIDEQYANYYLNVFTNCNQNVSGICNQTHYVYYSYNIDNSNKSCYNCMNWSVIQYIKNASLISTTTGNLTSGNLTSIQKCDKDYYIVQETVPFNIRINFTGLGFAYSTFNFTGRYQGTPSHQVELYAWNFNTSTFDDVLAMIKDFPSSSTDYNLSFQLPLPKSSYFGDNTTAMRIYHTSSAVSTHYFYIDCVSLIGYEILLFNITYEILSPVPRPRLIDCIYNPTPYIEKKIDAICYLSHTLNDTFKCNALIYFENNTLITSSPQNQFVEGIGNINYFKAKPERAENQIVNIEFDTRDLTEQQLISKVICLSNTGSKVTFTRYITPQYKNLEQIFDLLDYVKQNALFLVGFVVILIILLFLVQLVMSGTGLQEIIKPLMRIVIISLFIVALILVIIRLT